MAIGSPPFRRRACSRDVGHGGAIGAKKRPLRRQANQGVSTQGPGVGDYALRRRDPCERVAWCGVLKLFLQSRTSLSIKFSGDATGRADAGRWLRQGAAFAASCEGACHAPDVPDALPAIYANEAAAVPRCWPTLKPVGCEGSA